MTKSKTSTIFNIIGNGIKLYFQNLITLSTPILLPVIGMLFGIALMILPVYLLPKFYPIWSEALPILKETYIALISILICILPGLIIFKIGFWNYMINFVSLNSMIGDIIKNKIPKHYSHYTQIVKLRTKDYLLMLGIWCSIIIMGMALPFSIFLFNIEPIFIPYILIGLEFVAAFLLIILSVYLSLSFQVFAFETSFGPMQTLEESFKLVLNNFWRLVILAITLTVLTTILFPQIFVFLTDILLIKSTIALPIKALLENAVNNYADLYAAVSSTPFFIYDSVDKFTTETSKMLSFSLISGIISLLMLPLGSCLYTLFYFDAKKRHAPKDEVIEEKQTKTKTKSKSSKAKTK